MLLMLETKNWKEYYDKRKNFFEYEKYSYFQEMRNFHTKLISWLKNIPTENIQYFTNLRTKLLNSKNDFINKNFEGDIYSLGKSIGFLEFLELCKPEDDITTTLKQINLFCTQMIFIENQKNYEDYIS